MVNSITNKKALTNKLIEPQYCIKEAAQMLGISEDIARRVFRSTPGVINWACANQKRKSTGKFKLPLTNTFQ